MGWVTGIVVYLVIWFLVLFMVLPWGVRIPDEPEPGHARGAPSNPRIALKMGVTTLVAAVLWAGVYAVIDSGLVSFRAPAP